VPDRLFPIAVFVIGNELSLISTVVMIVELTYISKTVCFVCSLVFAVSLFHFVPFYRRIENCIYSGIAFAKMFLSIGPLFLYVSIVESDVEVQVLGGAFTGISVTLFIIGFLIGFFSMEIYTRLAVRSIRIELKYYFENRHTINIVSDLVGKNLMKNFNMFLKFACLDSKHKKEKSDHEMAFTFFKSVNIDDGHSCIKISLKSCLVSIQLHTKLKIPIDILII